MRAATVSIPPIIALALTLLSSGACRPVTLVSTGPHPSESAPSEGLRYYVPRDLLSLDAKVTTRTERRWESLTAFGNDSVRCIPSAPKRRWIHTIVDVNSVTNPDRQHGVYRLGIAPSGRVEQSLKMTVSDDGMLTALNYSSKDQSAEIIASVLKGVAGIAGAAVGMPTALASVPQVTQGLKTMLDLTPDRRVALTDEFCWTVTSPQATSLLAQRASLQTSLAKARVDRDTVLRRSMRAATESDAKRFQLLDALQQRRIDFVTQQLETVRAVIAAGTAAYAAKSGVGKSDTTMRHGVTVDLAKFPRTLPAAIVGDMRRANFDTALKAFFDSTYTVVVVRDLQIAAPRSVAASAERASLGCKKESDEACTRIRYREPIPRSVSVYVADSAVDLAPLRLRESRNVVLVSSTDPVLHVAFDAKKFGQAGTSLVFGRRGTVTGVEQTSNAGLATATSTIATALTTARQEFVSGLQSAQTTQTTLQAMQQANRSARIKELQDQKTVIDAELALQGASANRDLLAQKQSIDAQLALLQSQLALESTQLRGETATEISTMRLEIERLQTQIDLLKKQMELEQARREAEKLGKPEP